MTVYRIPIGSGVTFVDAADDDEAVRFVAQQLKVTHKPWLWRDLEVTEASAEAIDAHKALGGKVVKAKLKRDPAQSKDGTK